MNIQPVTWSHGHTYHGIKAPILVPKHGPCDRFGTTIGAVTAVTPMLVLSHLWWHQITPMLVLKPTHAGSM